MSSFPYPKLSSRTLVLVPIFAGVLVVAAFLLGQIGGQQMTVQTLPKNYATSENSTAVNAGQSATVKKGGVIFTIVGNFGGTINIQERDRNDTVERAECQATSHSSSCWFSGQFGEHMILWDTESQTIYIVRGDYEIELHPLE